MPPSTAYHLIHDELIMDGSSRFNLATFCSTWMEPEAHKLMAESFDKNMIDKDEYPQTAELEMRCVHMLAELWHSPDRKARLGVRQSGRAKHACSVDWRSSGAGGNRCGPGKSTDRPNSSWAPIRRCAGTSSCRYWDVEDRSVPLEGSDVVTDPERAAAACDENTIGVVSVLGSTFTGDYENV